MQSPIIAFYPFTCLGSPCKILTSWRQGQLLRSHCGFSLPHHLEISLHISPVLNLLLPTSHVFLFQYSLSYLGEHLLIAFFFYYWNIVDLQYCVSFRYSAKWLIYMCVCVYICIYIFSSDYFPLQVTIKYWIYFPVLYSKSLLLIYFMYNSLYLLISYA